MNFLVKNFLRGLVILVPIALTAYIVVATVIAIDRLIASPYPGMGIALTLLLILVVGILAGNIVGRTVFGLADRLFVRAPIVKIVYSGIKDLVEAFVGDKKKFNRPVAVTLSELGGAKALGFITREQIEFLPGSHIAVYFPQSYNFAGNLLLVPAERVQPIEADSANIMAFIVSGGISGSEPTP